MASGAGLRLDQERAEVWVAGRRIQLTAKELVALDLLASHGGRLVRKDDLAKAVWPENEGITSDGTIEKLISRLRQKLEPDPRAPRYLRTLRGLGYRLEAADLTAPEPAAQPARGGPYVRTGLVAGALVLLASIAGLDGLRPEPVVASNVSAVMMVPGAPDGPDAVRNGVASTTFAPLQRFAIRVDYGQLIEPFSVVSIGPAQVVHMDVPPPHEARPDFGTCCFVAPPQVGRYTLRVLARAVPGGQELLVEIPYEVRQPPD